MASLPDPIDVEVGARIRARRKFLKISQTHLATAVNLTFQQVQKYERGFNRVSASMLVHIARVLDTSVAELVGECDEVERPSTAVFRGLGIHGALEMLNAYASLADPGLRKAILDLTKALA